MAKEQYEFGQVNMKGDLGGRFAKAAEKPHDFKKAWLMILQYCLKFKFTLIAAMVATVGGAVFSLFGPDKLSRITDMIDAGIAAKAIDIDGIIAIGIQLVLLYVLSFALTYTQNYLLINLSQKTGKTMRTSISQKLNRIPLSRFDSASFGDLLSRVTNDVDTISDSMRQALGEIISALVLFIGSAVGMLLTNVVLAVVALTTSMVGFIFMNLIVRHSQKYFSQTSYNLGMINGHIEEMYAGHIIVKAYNGEAEGSRQFDEINEKLYQSSRKSQFYSGIMGPLMELSGNCGYLAVCVVGAILTQSGAISFGVIVAFIVYVKLFTQPLGQVAQAVTSLQSAGAAAERVFAFLDEDEMADESAKTKNFVAPKGRVVFDHVKFGYVPGKTIIHDFSVDIATGQKVAIVGPTGAGKTTMVNLLMRFYELDGGRILIDGTDIASISRDNVHQLFGMVLQDTWLFEDTIKNNIIYSKPNVTDQQVEQACQAVGLDHFIHSLPNGYDTILTDDSNLSAGQRQLMTIARTMVADAPLLILDEATSSVDTHTEQLVQQALEKLTEGRTSFTIAHRLSTIRDADLILVMKDGDIVEKGTHQQLLDANGFYADLWQSQFVNAESI